MKKIETLTPAEADRFVSAIDAMEVNYRIELENNGSMYFEYFIQGKGWEIEEFGQAIDSCIEELTFPPRIAEIIERRPKKFRTIDDIESRGSGELVKITAEEKDDIQSHIDKIPNPRLREICQRLAGRYPKDNMIHADRHICLTCLDRAVIEVYDPRLYRAAKERTLDTAQIRTLIVACDDCGAGRRQSERQEKPEKGKLRPMVAFDSVQMCRVVSPLPGEQVAELVTFMETWTPRNYHSEFADFA